MNTRTLARWLVAVGWLCGCASHMPAEQGPDGGIPSDPPETPEPEPDAPEPDSPLVIYHSGNQGLYDISLENDPDDPDTVWMSYTGVSQVNLRGHDFHGLETRLAVSHDKGVSWSDLGLRLNVSEIDPPPPSEYSSGEPMSWVHEVSNLVYDPSAEPSERWKLMWHRYLHVADGGSTGDDRKVMYGWIAMKTAASPEALAEAPERKLFSALAYDLAGEPEWSDTFVGPPELKLHELHPDLSGCLAFTEPGMWASSEALYASLVCLADGKGTPKIVLLKLQDGTWSYLGTAIPPGAGELEGDYKGFSASDLAEGTDGQLYLLATASVNGGLYDGCVAFAVEDVETATMRDDNGDGHPDVIAQAGREVHGGVNPGACGYASHSEGTGLTYGEIFPTEDPFARQYRSLVMLP